MIEVKSITDAADMQAALAIRQKVFVEEQQVPADAEYDEHESTARHYLATCDGVPCGAARWRRTPNGIKLERFAVLAEYRNKNVGSRLLETVIADVRAAYPKETMYLHAQVPAINLYARQGFEQEGDLFSECDIDHYKMVRRV